MPDADGRCLLHDAITRGDHFAATFLIQNGAGVGKAIISTKETPLHLAASCKPSTTQSSSSNADGSSSNADDMKEVMELMLEKGANPNAQDVHGR